MEKMLCLKDFIRESLIDIDKGVKEAKEKGVLISYEAYKGGNFHSSQKICFDLSVSLESEHGSEKEKSGGIGISVISGNIDKSDSVRNVENHENRIQFSVNVALGGQAKKK